MPDKKNPDNNLLSKKNARLNTDGIIPRQSVPSLSDKSTEQVHFSPMLHGKATDAISQMRNDQLIINDITGIATVKNGDVTLSLDDFNSFIGTLGVSTHKLLSTAVTQFTNLNHTGEKRQLRQLRVIIPLKEYAKKCGYDVNEHPENDSPEAIEKEKKRVKTVLDNVRRKINKDLNILFGASISWKEEIKGNERNFLDVHIIGSKGIKSGNILIEFTASMAEYLICLPLTQYPEALYRLDERNQNAYSIGYKIATYFSMDNNQIRGTANLLKVETLLKNTSLPTYEEVQEKDRGHWEQRIKEPFENALESLVKCGFLEDWRYSYSKGAELTDKEAENISDYQTFSQLFVYFTLKNAPNHIARIEEHKEKKENKKKK